MSLPRYAQYKDSGVEWVGAVPAHWDVCALNYRHEVALGKMLDAKQISGEHLAPYLRNTDVQWGSINTEGLPQMDFSGGDLSRFRLNPGDLLVCEGGEVGRAAIWQGQLVDCYYQKALHRLRPRTNRDATRFMYFALRGAVDSGIFVGEGGKATIAHLPAEAFRRYRFAFPPADEQLAIATFLHRETGKIDALIAEQEKLLTLLAEKRQATISDAVTRGLNPNTPMKDSGVPWLGEVPAHWEVRRLKTLSAFTTSGPRGWSDRITEEGSLFIQSGDLDDNLEVDFLNAKRVSVDEDAEAARTRLADGDIVICITGAKTGNVAVSGVIPEPAFVNQHLCLVRPSEEVHSRYLGLALKSRFGQVQLDLSQYGLKQGLSLENIRELLIVLPPHDEQLAIAARLDTEAGKFDRLTDDARHAIALLKERRSVLIAAAVTGKIDVRKAA